jgi:hypothetical protein
MERKDASAEFGVIEVRNWECRVRNVSEGDGRWGGGDEDPPSLKLRRTGEDEGQGTAER